MSAVKKSSDKKKKSLAGRIAVIALEVLALAVICVGIYAVSYVSRILALLHTDITPGGTQVVEETGPRRQGLPGIGEAVLINGTEAPTEPRQLPPNLIEPTFNWPSQPGTSAVPTQSGPTAPDPTATDPTRATQTAPSSSTETQPPTKPPATAAPTAAQPSTQALPPDVLKGMEGYLTLAVFGIDGGKTWRVDDAGNVMDWMNGDVVMIITVNLKTYEVKMVSIYRDNYFMMEDGKYDKVTDIFTRYSYFNHNSAAAGGAGTAKALNLNLDLAIDNYAVVDWTVIADVVDLMGGLEVPVSQLEAESMNDYIEETGRIVGREVIKMQGSYSESKPTKLDGIQTVTYCRIRNVGHADYARTERQREVVGLMLQKARTLSIGKLMDIVEVVAKEIYTDIDNATLLSLVMHVLTEPRLNITGTQGYPKTTAWTNYYKGYVYSKNVIESVTELHQFLYNDYEYSPSATVRAFYEHILYMMSLPDGFLY